MVSLCETIVPTFIELRKFVNTDLSNHCLLKCSVREAPARPPGLSFDQDRQSVGSLLKVHFATERLTGTSFNDDSIRILTEMATRHRCRLLELPAEIRNSIYHYALAPTGSVALTSTKTKRFAITPTLAPALLATCNQIHSEAANILYSDNTVCITVDAEDTCWPTIAETRLPQRSLEKLQHLFVILDCTAQYFNASFADVDWAPFSALTSLKTLRLAILIHRNSHRFAPTFLDESVTELLTQVLERVPAYTSIFFEIEEGSEEHPHLAHVIGRLQRYLPPDSIIQVDADTCERARDNPVLEQGCKSGALEDVFAEYRNYCQVIRGTP